VAEHDNDHPIYRLPWVGTIGTCAIPAALGHFSSSAEGWQRRIQSGQAMTAMVNTISRIDPQLAIFRRLDRLGRERGNCLSRNRRGRNASSAISL
jgi:hypothetical protein